MVFVKNGAVFVVSGGANAAQAAFGQGRFEQIRRIHGAAGHAACADNGVDFIHKQHRPLQLRQLFEHGFHACFKITTVFGARQ